MRMPTPVRSRVPLPEISSRAWEHPADQGALVALRRLRGFDTLVRRLSALFNERAVRLQYLGSAVRVDDRQFARLHTLLAEVATVLDAPEAPELYVSAAPDPQAMTIGMDKAFVVVTSGLVDLLDEEELRFVLGHEMGHVLSGHAVYQTLLQRLIQLSGVLNAIPIGGLGVRAITAALMEWSRRAELSADRAGLLATQDPAVAFRVHMKLASGGHLDDLDPTSFFAQGAEYDATGDLRDSLVKLMLVEAQSHPFAVVRASELRRWVDSGAYTRILGGAYPRRAEDADAKVSEAAQHAARSYAESFRQSQDAVTKLVRDASGTFAAVRDWVGGQFGPPGGSGTSSTPD
ncbi:M48 family metallopeptidase [soil metagenome]